MFDFEVLLELVFFGKLTGIDRSPWIDPLYWYGRAPRIGYWTLVGTVTLSWLAALTWIVFVIRRSRRESFEDRQEDP